MFFAHPLILAAGLTAVALPVLIHILMRRRRRPVRWAAMRFLLEAARRQRQRVRFEQWLLLLARCLLVALAALAIARPRLPGADPLLGSTATTMYVVIDNSLASTVGSPGAIESHKDAAVALLERLDPLRGDRAALVTLAGPSSGVVMPPSSAIQSVIASVRAVEAGDSAADVHGALTRIAAEISQPATPGGRSVVALVSELRAGSVATDRPLPALGGGASEAASLTLAATRPAVEALDNTAIVAVEPLQPIVLGTSGVSTTQVRVRASRFGAGVARRAEVPVELSIAGGVPVAQGTLVFEAGSREAAVALGVDGSALGDLRRDGAGSVVLTARLGLPDALARDNVRRGVVDRRESLGVGLVAPRRFGPRPSVGQFRAGDWAWAALDPEGLREGSEMRVEPIDPGAVDASTLAGLEGVVVAEPQGLTAAGWAALRRFADLGGLVVLMPQPGDGAQVWTDGAMGALGLEWDLPREAVVVAAEEAEESGELGGVASAGVGAIRVPEAPSPLLSMIEGELEEMIRPIGVERALPVEMRGAGGHALLVLEDGRVLAAAGVPGGGSAASADESLGSRGLVVYIGVAMDLGWSDLPTKPLLLPLVQEIVRQGVSRAGGGGVAVAGARAVASSGAVELAWEGGEAPAEARRVPLHPSGVSRQAMRHAGVYRGLDVAGATQGVVLVNPDTRGSDTEVVGERDLSAWLETAGAGRPLWIETGGGDEQGGALASTEAGEGDGRDVPWLPVLLGVALALAGLEAVAARRFSHAGVAIKGGA